MATNEKKELENEKTPYSMMKELCRVAGLPIYSTSILGALSCLADDNNTIHISDHGKSDIATQTNKSIEKVSQYLIKLVEKKFFKDIGNGTYEVINPELLVLMKEVETSDSTDLVEQTSRLPVTAPELQKFVIIARERIVAFQAELRAMKRLDVIAEVYNQKLEEAQDLGEVLLDAEVKLGELLKDNFHSTSAGQPVLTLADLGLNKNQSYKAQRLAAYPDIVEQIKKDARDKDRIPVRARALTAIGKLKQKAEKQTDKKPTTGDKSTIDAALSIVIKMCKKDAKWFDYVREKIDHADMLGS